MRCLPFFFLRFKGEPKLTETSIRGSFGYGRKRQTCGRKPAVCRDTWPVCGDHGRDGQVPQMKIQDINTLSPDEISQEIEKVRTRQRVHFQFRHRLTTVVGLRGEEAKRSRPKPIFGVSGIGSARKLKQRISSIFNTTLKKMAPGHQFSEGEDFEDRFSQVGAGH